MSRSYKKNLVVTDNKGSKYGKRQANQRFRRQINLDDDMPARPQHRKYTQSWDICDYKWRMTKQEAIEWYNEQLEWQKNKGSLAYFLRHYPTLEAWLKYWDKCYRRK